MYLKNIALPYIVQIIDNLIIVFKNQCFNVDINFYAQGYPQILWIKITVSPTAESGDRRALLEGH